VGWLYAAADAKAAGQVSHVAQQILEGITSLTPAGAALGILTLTETTKWKVAVGEYNKMLDKRIAEIKAECGP